MAKKNDALSTRPFTPFDDEPDIQEIQEAISNGSSLVQYCKQNNLPFGATRKWILQDENRKLAYTSAMEARTDYYLQSLYHMIVEIASFDPQTIEDDMGNLLPLSQWPPQARAALVAITGKDGELSGAKFTPKLEAIKTLGQAISMFNQKPKDSVEKKGLADLIAEIESDDE